MSNKIEEETDRLLMHIFNSFTRKVTNTWISPAKSRGYYEDLRRVFFKDGSPEGLYPACVVMQNLLGEIVVITPLGKFQKLLDEWKKHNPTIVERAKKIAIEREKSTED